MAIGKLGISLNLVDLPEGLTFTVTEINNWKETRKGTFWSSQRMVFIL